MIKILLKMPSKRSFLLLELLIALFLISVCALPLSQLPMRAAKETFKSAWRIELHHAADLNFAEVQEKFYTSEINAELLEKSLHERLLFKEKIEDLTCPLLGKKSFRKKIFLSSSKKQTKSGDCYYLVDCIIQFEAKKLFRTKKAHKDTKSYVYKTFVVKKSLENPV